MTVNNIDFLFHPKSRLFSLASVKVTVKHVWDFQGISKHIFTQVASEEKTSLTCSLCGKHFSSQNAQQDHLRSKKHKENEAKMVKGDVKVNNKKNEASKSEVKNSWCTKFVWELEKNNKQTDTAKSEINFLVFQKKIPLHFNGHLKFLWSCTVVVYIFHWFRWTPTIIWYYSTCSEASHSLECIACKLLL